MDTIEQIVEKQQAFFRTDATKSVEFRVEMLRKLEKAVREQEGRILTALELDLGKSKAEGYMSEISIVYGELRAAIRGVRKWARPKRVRGTMGTFPAANVIYPEPYGVVLIMAPWNYPFNLSLAPLIGAIAAGNCAVVKCSRNSVHTSAVIREIISAVFDPEYVCCVNEQADYDEVVRQKYDYIFFTGSMAVGRKIMQAAGEELIPVSLELGGKCPCIVDETADLKLAAKRIAWGKFLNAGQTCVSVDYILVQRSVKDAFLYALEREIARRYPDAVRNPSYPKIINRHHYERLSALIETETVVIGGEKNELQRKIGPTIFPAADFDHEIMKEEIFGPLLPVIAYEDLDQVIDTLKRKEKPLACYIFTGKRSVADLLIRSLSYGGGCVNDVILHTANHHLPFGGVGHSGMGAYHGKFSFDTFTHYKGMVENRSFPDMPIRYAPFDEKKYRVLKKLLK